MIEVIGRYEKGIVILKGIFKGIKLTNNYKNINEIKWNEGIFYNKFKKNLNRILTVFLRNFQLK